MQPLQFSRRYWKAALGLLGLLAVLYLFELVSIAGLLFSHREVFGEITSRREGPAFAEIEYRYSLDDKAYTGTKRYRFPERLFVSGMTEGEKVPVLVSPSYPWFSLPRALLTFEVFSACLMLGLIGWAGHRAWTKLTHFAKTDGD